MRKYISFVLVLCFGVLAFGQDAAEAVTEVVAQPTFLDGILAWLDANTGLIAMAVGLGEALMRLIPTKKALSTLILVKYVAHGLSVILQVVADVAEKLTGAGNLVKK